MVHLIDDEIGRRQTYRTFVLLPPFRVSVAQVEYITLLAIGTYCLGKDTRCVTMTSIKHIGLSFLVTLDGGCPQAVAHLGHLDLLLAYLDIALGIVGCKQLKGGLLW